MLVTNDSEAFKKTGHWADHAHIARDGLHDDRRNIAAVHGKELLDCLEIVVRERQGKLGKINRHASRVWLAHRQRAAASFD